MEKDILMTYGRVFTVIFTFIVATLLPSFLTYFGKNRRRKAAYDTMIKTIGSEEDAKEKYGNVEGTLDAWGHKLPKFKNLITEKGVTPLFVLTIFNIITFVNISWYNVYGWILGILFLFLFLANDEFTSNKWYFRLFVLLGWIAILIYIFPWDIFASSFNPIAN
ncbi:MAG: hypothetical protein KQI35_01205 [Bacteroidetes bacterium]|nr:hypothetical protein [Bacteroidota bacterium]